LEVIEEFLLLDLKRLGQVRKGFDGIYVLVFRTLRGDKFRSVLLSGFLDRRFVLGGRRLRGFRLGTLCFRGFRLGCGWGLNRIILLEEISETILKLRVNG
jgi:hypothetical protein